MGVRIFDFFQYLDVYLSFHKNSPRNLSINCTVQILCFIEIIFKYSEIHVSISKTVVCTYEPVTLQSVS